MAGKHQQERAHRSHRRIILMVILLVVALAAVIFSFTALWRALHGADVLPGGGTTPQPGQTQDEQPSGGGDSAADSQRAQLLDKAKTLYQGYYYEEAIEALQNCGELENSETQALLQEIQQAKDSLVKFDAASQQCYHIFFHSLVVDTAKAFDGDSREKGYDMYMTTVSEFQAMLPLLQEEGYILYNIRDMVELKDGKTVMKDIYLPAGKKPLVLSIDDVNYYDYMMEDGFASAMDVDAEGNVVTIVNGQPTYDGDVMPILDAYVKAHPEFSWRGAKGIVAITGYQGAFGYRITDLERYDEATQKQMLSKVTEVAKALRSTGWEIACHSYTHNQYWNKKTITMEQEKYDIGRWLGEIAPYVGDTPIFISPFGVSFEGDDQRFRYLVDNGFYIYCPVDSRMPTYVKNDYFIQGRLNLDGLTMQSYPERVTRYFFDPAKVLDQARPGK